MQEFFGAYAGRMDECISSLRKECSLDFDPKIDTQPSDEFSEDWTMFQNAFHLIQICGKQIAFLFFIVPGCTPVWLIESRARPETAEKKIRKIE